MDPNPARSLRIAAALSLALAACAVAPAPAAAFSFNAVLWDIADSPIVIELHDAGVDDLSVEDLEGVVNRTIDAWNAVPCSQLKLVYGGRTPDHIAVDQRQILEFIEDQDQWVYGSMAAGAMVADVFDNPDTPEREAPRVDIAFNGVNFGWAIGGSGDITDTSTLDPESVLTHEMGHLLGLSHTPDTNAATMAAAYIPDLGQRSLSFDDMTGLCEKYWTDGDDCATDADCASNHTCALYTRPDNPDQTARLCAEPHGTYGDPCSGDNLNCIGFCRFTRNDFSEGFCTTQCADDDPNTCPAGWECANIGTPFAPLLACRPDPDAPVNNTPADAGGDATGQDATDDTSNPGQDASTPDSDPGTSDDAAVTPDTPSDQDAADDGGAEGSGDAGIDCACATPATPSSPVRTPLALLTLIAALGLFSRRRRRRHRSMHTPPQRRRLAARSSSTRASRASKALIACALGAASVAACVAAPRDAQAQDMSFAAEEVKQRAYVRVLSARKVRIGTRRKLVAALKDAVANKDGYELLSDREIKSALGRKWWNFKRCKDTGCILEHAPEAGIDRLILITLSQDPNGLTLDLEVDDAYSREALKVTSITTDDPNSNTQTFAAEAIEELLTVKKDDPPPPPAPQAKPIELIEGDPDAEMRDDEPFAIAPVWSYSTIGLGVAMLGAGGVFGLRAGNTQTEIQSEPHSRDDLDALIAQGESDQSLANTFYIAGGVVTTLGVAMLLFLGPDEDPSGAAARQRDPDAPRATPDPVRVHLGLTGVQLEVDFGL